jgi:hypothetical protein
MRWDFKLTTVVAMLVVATVFIVLDIVHEPWGLLVVAGGAIAGSVLYRGDMSRQQRVERTLAIALVAGGVGLLVHFTL